MINVGDLGWYREIKVLGVVVIFSGLFRWVVLFCICFFSVFCGVFFFLMDCEEESWGVVLVGGGGGKFMNFDYVKCGMNGIIMFFVNLFERV